MALSNIRKCDLNYASDSVHGTHKGWDFIVEVTGRGYTFSLSISTDENSDCGVYWNESGAMDTIAEVKEEIKCVVSDLDYTAKEAAKWNIKLGNGVREFGVLVNEISEFERRESAGEPKVIEGSVKVSVKQGMKARIVPECFEGKQHKGKEFVIAGEPRDLCGTEVVALDNLDGSRFSACYDLSMLQITDTMGE